MRREEHTQSRADLRHLGPDITPNQVLTTTDAVLTRKLARRRFNELRTARVVTTPGSRSLSGVGDRFLTLLLVMVLRCAGRQRVVLLADGAGGIRNWFAALAALRAASTMILDWYHCKQERARQSGWFSVRPEGTRFSVLIGSLYSPYRWLPAADMKGFDSLGIVNGRSDTPRSSVYLENGS